LLKSEEVSSSPSS